MYNQAINDFDVLINLIDKKRITKPREKLFDIISDVIEVFSGKKHKISDYFKNVDRTEYIDISKKVKILKEIISNMGNNKKIPSEGHGLEIMTPNQLIARLPISLAQKRQEIITKN